MGFFSNLFKKTETAQPKQTASTTATGTEWDGTFDYFAFKVHGTASIDGVQDILKSLGNGLTHDPKEISLKLGEYEGQEALQIFYKDMRIGSADTQALNKFKEHCMNNKKWNVHSISVYGGDDGKAYGCKIRVKYFL